MRFDAASVRFGRSVGGPTQSCSSLAPAVIQVIKTCYWLFTICIPGPANCGSYLSVSSLHYGVLQDHVITIGGLKTRDWKTRDWNT